MCYYDYEDAIEAYVAAAPECSFSAWVDGWIADNIDAWDISKMNVRSWYDEGFDIDDAEQIAVIAEKIKSQQTT